MLTLLTNAQVYAPASVGIHHLLIGGGKILWMGQSGDKLPTGSMIEVYDVAGRTLTPGFIDGHAHVTGGGGESGYASRVPPVTLERFTQAGTTTVVGLLGTDDTTRDTKSLLAQTRALQSQGLNAYCYTGGYHIPPVTLTGCVRSDIVNLEPVIGVGEIAISDHRSSQPTINEILRIASDTHVAGMMTGKAGILHLHLGDGERGLDMITQCLKTSEIPARVFNPTHVNRKTALFEQACQLAQQGVYVDLTAFPVEKGEDAYTAADSLIKYFDSGAPVSHITISSDGGGCLPHFDQDGHITHMDIGEPASLIDTLFQLVDSGCPLETALPALTTNPAALLRLHQKGHIDVGFDADLLILDDNKSVDAVMIGGKWHRRDQQQLIFDNFTNSL